MSKEKKLIPELRFPEFANEGGWEEKVLSNISVITNGKANAQDHIEGGEYPLFDRSEVIKASDEFLFNCEAVIIPGEGMRFIPKYYEGKFNLHQRAYALKDFSCYGRFVYQSMLHRSNLISCRAVQSTVLSLRLPILHNFPIEIPRDTREQQKIADCLSSLDELITAHNDKLAALKDHKKGLLQNLFPQEGETVPKVRFPEFEGDGEWVEDTLGKRGNFTGGGTPSKSKLEYWDGGFPWVSSSDIDEESIHKIQITRFITEEAIKESATKIVPSNSLLIVSRVGVGKVAFSKEEICTSQDFSSFTPHKDDPIFLGYYLKSNKNILLSFSQGMAIKGFTKEDISTLSLFFPSKQEQQKIASCLSAVDELINAQQERIEQLQQHKKGLMQGLFPRVTD